MPFGSELRAVVVVLVSLCGAVGCPVLLSDDFSTVPRGPKDGGMNDGAGGSSPDAEIQILVAGAAGTGVDAGAGASPSGGGAGSGGRMSGSGANGGNTSNGGSGGAGAIIPSGWSAMAKPDTAFVAREQAAFTAVGATVFIWGGADQTSAALETGALYDANLDTWTNVATDAATPSARVLATAVWTGTTVVVWGGGDYASLTDYASGSRYDPAARKWSSMSTAGAPSPRRAPYGVWTGTKVLFWGGVTAAHVPVGGAYLYDPVTDVWSAASVTSEPVASMNTTTGWTGSELIVYGGRPPGASATGHTAAYDPAMDLWSQLPTGPQAREGAFGSWDGASFVAWGGIGSNTKKDGQRYSVAKGAWSNMANGGLSARYTPNRETGWSARAADMTTLILGGYDDSQTPLTDGAYYEATSNTWTAVEAWPSGSGHLWGVGVWAGPVFVLWSGRTTALGAPTAVGERLRF